MGETRSGKWGRNAAIVVNCIISTLPEDRRKSFRRKFLREVKKYKVCRELDGLEEIDPRNPIELARWYKEAMHLMYQETTSRRALKSLVEYLG